MAATTSNPAPRKNGFDFAALTASAGKQDSADEVARLRAALETLAELVIAHGVMDPRTLESIVGDLIRPPMAAKSLSSPLPPPAPSAAEALLRGPLPKPAPVATRPIARPIAQPAPVAAKPAPTPMPAPMPMPAPVAAKPAPMPMPQPAPVAAKPAPAPIAQPVVQQAIPQPVPAAQPVQLQVQAMPMPAPVAQPDPIVPPSSVQPVVASPFPSEPAPSPVARKNPFDPKNATQIEAELTEAPSLTPKGSFFSRLFGRPKTSPAAVAANAASIEFTERVPKLPVDGLYAEQQRATELSFPPTAPEQRKPRAAAAAPRKKSARPADAAPARFCDRCWRRMEPNGTCKTCSPSASA